MTVSPAIDATLRDHGYNKHQQVSLSLLKGHKLISAQHFHNGQTAE